MQYALLVIAGAWLGWAALCLLALLCAPLLAPSYTATTNGLFVSVPSGVRSKLTDDELLAIVAHEKGHRALLHVQENLLRACFFIRRLPERAVEQELEADDWAAKRIDPLTLACALRKLSSTPFDLFRASRLERIGAGQAS